MKRVLFGVLWCIVFFIVLYIIYSIVLALIITHGSGAHPANYQEVLQAGMAFAQTHAHSLAVWRLVVLIIAIVLAVAGSIKGVLPGTRKRLPAAAPE
ncbi:MAG: hypothetical protein ACRESA_06990 [Gammaproteobacteria bacterium]